MLTNLKKTKISKLPRVSKIAEHIRLFGILAVLILASTSKLTAAEITLETLSGATINGLLVKKSEKEIEVQTTYGTVQIKEKDITPQSWYKAQRTITSRPKKLKNEEFTPKPRRPKEIKVSSKPQDDKPVAIPYTGFTKTTQELADSPAPTNGKREGEDDSPGQSSTLYITTSDEQPWKLESIQTTIPTYEDIKPPADSINVKLPQEGTLTNEVLKDSKKDAVRLFLPLTIVALSLVLLAKSQLSLRIKIASYVILGFLLLSIFLENTLFGVMAIATLCLLMIIVEILSARKQAIEEALNLTRSQKTTDIKEPKEPNIKKPTISAYQLSLLEWKKFEEFCCLWLEGNGFEVQRSKAYPNDFNNRIIEGRLPSKSRLKGSSERPPRGKKFKAICKNLEREITIKDVKTIRRECTSTEVPIIISIYGFDPDAVAWAKEDRVRLISHKELTKGFGKLPEATKTKIVETIWDGTQESPTCPVCNQKMQTKKEHTDPKGNYKTHIWYCHNYETCHQRIASKMPKPVKEDIVYPDYASLEND
jgi:diacylglycerol kinase